MHLTSLGLGCGPISCPLLLYPMPLWHLFFEDTLNVEANFEQLQSILSFIGSAESSASLFSQFIFYLLMQVQHENRDTSDFRTVIRQRRRVANFVGLVLFEAGVGNREELLPDDVAFMQV